jgi:hypothetical protein
LTSIHILFKLLIILCCTHFFSHCVEATAGDLSTWHLSVQYLGLTLHPNGGTNSELYPLKFDRKGYFVPEIGSAVKLDYRLSDSFFLRFISALYKDCAFVTAGCIHAGPRIQYSWRNNSFNTGIGPIFSFRKDWHRFNEYQDDEFYGDRVSGGWQYRLFPYAIEMEYLHRINDSTELQWSIIPGAPLVITFMFGIRYKL